jgi:hypothetical protein
MSKELICIPEIDIPDQLMKELDYQKLKSIPFQFSSIIDLTKYNINSQSHPLIALNANPFVHAQLWMKGFETLELCNNGAYRMKLYPELRNQGASITYISLVCGKIEPLSRVYDKILYYIISENLIDRLSLSTDYLMIIRALGYGFIKIIPIPSSGEDLIRDLGKIGITKENISQIAISVPVYIAAQLWGIGFQTIEFIESGAYIVEFNSSISLTWIPLKEEEKKKKII